jgi:L-amino acid N-acyltransferase
MIIRNARATDMRAVTDLSNATILTTTAAWTSSPETYAARAAWFGEQRRTANPVLVAEAGTANQVVGFASYGDFRDSTKWPGYRFTVEHSIHVREDHWGRGIGRALLEALIAQAVANDKHAMVAAVDGANDASIRFHDRLGFVEVARMPQIGRKFDRWLDLVLMQRILGPATAR